VLSGSQSRGSLPQVRLVLLIRPEFPIEGPRFDGVALPCTSPFTVWVTDRSSFRLLVGALKVAFLFPPFPKDYNTETFARDY